MPETTQMDPFFFDGEELRKIAEERELRLGLASFKDHRVIEIDRDGQTLAALVEDEETKEHLQVRIDLVADGRLSFFCDCTGDNGPPVCRHLWPPSRPMPTGRARPIPW